RDWNCCVSTFEAGAVSGEGVDIWRANLLVTVAAEVIGTQSVNCDKHYVCRSSRLRGISHGERRCEECASKATVKIHQLQKLYRSSGGGSGSSSACLRVFIYGSITQFSSRRRLRFAAEGLKQIRSSR